MTIHSGLFRAPVIRTLRISYHVNVMRDGGVVIPLGVLSELEIGGFYGLGLASRAQISDEEAALIGALVRDAFIQPAEILGKEFAYILAADNPTEAFDLSCERHHGALTFGKFNETTVAIPKPLKCDASDEAMMSFIEDQLRAKVVQNYWELLAKEDHLSSVLREHELIKVNAA